MPTVAEFMHTLRNAVNKDDLKCVLNEALGSEIELI